MTLSHTFSLALVAAISLCACSGPTPEPDPDGPLSPPDGKVVAWGTWLMNVSARPLEECGEDPEDLPPYYKMDKWLDDLCTQESDDDGFFLDRCGAEDEVRCRFTGTDFECDPFEYSTQLDAELIIEARITLEGTVESRDMFTFTQSHEVTCIGSGCPMLPTLPCTNIYTGWADCCD